MIGASFLAGTLGLLLAASPKSAGASGAASPPPGLETFRTQLQELAAQHHLPGLSGAVIRDGKLLWSGGFGYADLENEIPADAGTPYRLASLSKTVAALVLMQLVDEERLDLDALMREFMIHPWFEPGGGSWAHYPSRYTENPVTVRHVLTHTSQSTPPGDAYNYNGNIFADLTWVVESVTRRSYPTVVAERILVPLGMTRSSPGHLFPSRQDVTRALAKPYQLKSGNPVPATYPGFGLDPDVDVRPWNLDPAYRLPHDTQAARRNLLGKSFTPLYSCQTAAGLIASVDDLVRFDLALDGGALVSDASLQKMFTAARSSNGDTLPYGLGWFVEDWDGTKLVWHYGWFPPTISTLYIKVPERKLTLVLLANCDGLSADVPWTALGVRASPFARLFFEHFLPD